MQNIIMEHFYIKFLFKIKNLILCKQYVLFVY